MRQVKNIRGEVFGNFTVVDLEEKIGNSIRWKCRCSCGRMAIIYYSALKRQKSCGECYKESIAAHIDETIGKKFNRLTVLRQHPDRKGMWICRCDCGALHTCSIGALKSDSTKSCGCIRRERFMTHGQSDTRLYQTWLRMKRRCLDESNDKYKYYGGRGIRVCRRWLRFEDFQSDMGPTYQPGLTIERKDVNGHYSKRNCEWVSMFKQASNKRNNVKITHKGRTETVTEWSRITGIGRSAINGRLKAGLPPDKIFDPKPRLRGSFQRKI